MHPKRWQVLFVAVALSLLGSVSLPARAQPANSELILATTTSTQDSGLLDTLVPMFEQESGYRVKTISVGTGQAMALGERGEADVLLVHAPPTEKTWMAPRSMRSARPPMRPKSSFCDACPIEVGNATTGRPACP